MDPFAQPTCNSLLAYQESLVLLTMVKEATRWFKGPGARKAVEQLLEAAESICSNISEGYHKGHSPDCIRFQKMAAGSAGEVETRLNTSVLVGRVEAFRVELVIRQSSRTRSLIQGYIRYVERRMRDTG